jgi:hypothetical protein
MHALDQTFSELSQELDELASSPGTQTPVSREALASNLLSEADEMGLAVELLSVTSEAELDQFLGKLIQGVGKFVKSPVGRALGGIFKTVATKALPIVGNLIAPGIGGVAGHLIASGLKGHRRHRGAPHPGRLRDPHHALNEPHHAPHERDHDVRDSRADARDDDRASEMFGLELEGLSTEDRHFEVARHFVRFAIAATQELSSAAPAASPRATAIEAATSAAREHAPGLLEELASETEAPRTDRGQWVRRGHSIVLFGVGS